MSDTDTGWMEPLAVSDIDIAFPVRAQELTPDYETCTPSSKQWEGVADRVLSDGWHNLAYVAKDGISPESAHRHLAVVLGSYSMKHQHKINGAAYLMEQWFLGAAKAVVMDDGDIVYFTAGDSDVVDEIKTVIEDQVESLEDDELDA